MKKILISIIGITALLISFIETSSANYSYNNSPHITSVSYSGNNKIIRFSNGTIRTESGNISRSSSYRNTSSRTISNQSSSRTYYDRSNYTKTNYNRYNNNSNYNNNRYSSNTYSNSRYYSNGYPRY